jgi:hypothetical protein
MASKALKNSDLERLLALPESFAEAHIPVRAHLGSGIFLLANGDLGVVYSLAGVYDELTGGEDLQVAVYPLMKFMRQIVLGIPSHASLRNTVVQLICSQREVKDVPEKVVAGAPYNFSETDVGGILGAEERRLFQMGLVRRRFLVAVRYTPPKSKAGIAQPLLRTVRDLFREEKELDDAEQKAYAAAVREFENALTPLEAEMATAWPLARLTTEELVAYYGDVLHGARPQKLLFPREEGIHEGIYNPVMAGGADGVLLGDGREIRPFVLAQLPSEYSLGRFRHFIESLPLKDFDLVWAMSHGMRDFGQALAIKASWFSHGPAHRTKLEDLSHFQDNIDSLRPHGVQSVRLLTYGVSDSVASQIQTLAMDYIGARMVPERQLGVHMVASSLPLCLSREGNKLTGRSQTVRLENASFFWPIYDGPGAEAGTRWHVSRSLTPTRFDLFAGEGNRMTTVLGTSRAGKSVLMNQLLLEFMDRYPNGIIRVIDKKTSYLKLAELFGGKIVSFSEEALRKSPYSPFALASWDDDDIEGIYVLVATALVQKNPGIELTALHTEILRDAIKIAYNNQLLSVRHADHAGASEIDPHPIWQNILAALPVAANVKTEAGVKGADAARADLAAWSVSLGPSGQYGFVFARHEKRESATAAASFLVYDLDGTPDPVLQVLAAQMAFLKISRDLAKVPRSTPKLIVFEELGMLLHGDGDAQNLNAEFIQNVVKTCAKLNAQAISLTNGVGDYADKPAGRTLWTIATQKLFLPLGSAMVGELKEKFPGEFTPPELQILESLEINRKLKRSQLYVKSDNSDAPYRGTVFLPLSPAMDALVTSSGSQVELYQRLRGEGKTPAEAIAHMTTHYPYGQATASREAAHTVQAAAARAAGQ